MNRNLFSLSVLVCVLAFLPLSSRAEEKIGIMPDVVYGHRIGMALTYDVLIPKAKVRNRAGVVYVISENWESQWGPPAAVLKDAEKTNNVIAQLLNKGFTVFLVRHGSSPAFKMTDTLTHVRDAVRSIRASAAEFKLDPERIGILGGHLALMIGTTADGGNPAVSEPMGRTGSYVGAVVSFWARSDLAAHIGNKKIPALRMTKAQAEELSPLNHVSPDDAPTLLVHGALDKEVKPAESKAIHDALMKEEVPTKYVEYENAAGRGLKGADTQKAYGQTVRWFERYLITQDPGESRKKRYAKARSQAPPISELYGSWDMKVVVKGGTVDYTLNFEKIGDAVKAFQVSARSGSHPFHVVKYEGGDLTMQLKRTLGGEEIEYLYTGRLTRSGLLGTFANVGAEGSSQWAAQKK